MSILCLLAFLLQVQPFLAETMRNEILCEKLIVWLPTKHSSIFAGHNFSAVCAGAWAYRSPGLEAGRQENCAEHGKAFPHAHRDVGLRIWPGCSVPFKCRIAPWRTLPGEGLCEIASHFQGEKISSFCLSDWETHLSCKKKLYISATRITRRLKPAPPFNGTHLNQSHQFLPVNPCLTSLQQEQPRVPSGNILLQVAWKVLL